MRRTNRFKAALKVLLRGEPQARRRSPIPAIAADEIVEFRRFFPRPKFFVFGHARSGTTLLTRLIRLHPEVHCNYQAHFFTRRPLLSSLVDSPEVEEWLTRKSNRWNHGKDLSSIVLRAAAEYIMEREAEREGKSIVGDKSPSSTIHGQSVRDLHGLFPDAKVVYIVRDGRDVLISERFRNFVEESRFLSAEDNRILAELRKDPAAFLEHRRSMFSEAMIRRVATGWVKNVTEIHAEGTRLFGESYLSLRFEDVLRDPVEELGRAWQFLGAGVGTKALGSRIRSEMASNPDEEWQARRDKRLSALLPKGKRGNWESLFTARDKRVFKEIAGLQLIEWNYEESLDW
jgi:hypothetical protein